MKCHVASESHTRKMLTVASDFKKYSDDFSGQFQRDFLQQLHTAHGTKLVHINHFYQEYIHNKEHVHMNATRWKSLTEFAKFLAREGICRVEETDKGLHISWIDNSPDALRRQEALRKRERMDKGAEEREQRLILDQVERAQEVARDEDEDSEARELQRTEGEKITLNFGMKAAAPRPPTPPTNTTDEIFTSERLTAPSNEVPDTTTPPAENAPAAIKMSFGSTASKPKNVFAMKKNPLAAKKSKA